MAQGSIGQRGGAQRNTPAAAVSMITAGHCRPINAAAARNAPAATRFALLRNAPPGCHGLCIRRTEKLSTSVC